MTYDVEVQHGSSMKSYQWMTPEWAAALLVERYFADLGRHDRVLEPSCGRGAFLKAIPDHAQAVGVEIDPTLAAAAAAATTRQIIVGDFRTVDLPWDPTVVLGNPPFSADLIDAFLTRARKVLPTNGRCGFLLPAYALQTPRRVNRWAADWSMSAEILPRTLFMRSRLPLVFVQFQKSAVRVMSGFALFREAEDVTNLADAARLVLVAGRPRVGVWRALVTSALEGMGGRATLAELYAAIEPKRPTPNAWWREKVRQTLQLYCVPVARGEWELPRSEAA